jgi:hypothetical protein
MKHANTNKSFKRKTTQAFQSALLLRQIPNSPPEPGAFGKLPKQGFQRMRILEAATVQLRENFSTRQEILPPLNSL